MTLPSDDNARALDEAIGPFYDQDGLRNSFGIQGDDIDRRVESREILCLRSIDGHRLYPAFQFGTRGELLPRLPELLEALDPDDEDAWGDALWLNDLADELGGLTPAEALQSEQAPDAIRLAGQTTAFL